MKQLEYLEQELNMMLDNIERIKKYKDLQKDKNWEPSQSNVVGELKHRMVSLKHRMTLVSSINTSDLFKD